MPLDASEWSMEVVPCVARSGPERSALLAPLMVSGRSAMVVPWLLRESSAPALSLLTVLLLLPARVLAVLAVALLLPP